MNPFKQFNRSILKPLHILWEKVHALENMRGDGFINIKRSSAGTTVGLNLQEARKRIAKAQDNSGRTRIFQVRSWAEPFVFDGDSYDRTGVYNCVEMTIDDRDGVTGTYTLTESAANNGFEGRITQKDGVVNSDFKIGSILPSQQEDFEEWDSSVTYSVDQLAQLTTEYIETASSLTRKVITVYRALKENTNKRPTTGIANITDSNATWVSITFEVYNLCEQYVFSNGLTDPKLARFDIVVGNTIVDNQGAGRIVGNDSVGMAKAFYLDPDATTGSTAVGNLIYGAPVTFTSPEVNIFNEAQEGELGYNVSLAPDGVGQMDWSSFTQEVTLIAFWVNGLWFMRTVLPNLVSNNEGLRYDGVSMEVKADGTTIGFDGTGQLKQLP